MVSLKDTGDTLGEVNRVFAGKANVLGNPDAPTQAGFLALARAGRDVWNLWRDAWPKAPANFDSINFLDAAIDFSGFHFGWDASFERAQFGDGACFDRAEFGGEVNFSGAQFGREASFLGAQFSDITHFNGAHFGAKAKFAGARFGAIASFHAAQFDDNAGFDKASFGFMASFIGAQFGAQASFDDTQFGDSVRFDGAQFGDAATFNGTRFGDDASFVALDGQRVEGIWQSECDDELAVENRIKRAKELNLRSDAFQGIYFLGAQFAGDVTFRNREFQDRVTFGPWKRKVAGAALDESASTPSGQTTCFEGVPVFHGCKLPQDTSFEGVKFLAPPSQDAARAYRTLKLAMAQQHAIRDEQLFFRLEMVSESPSTNGAKWVLSKLYMTLSDYGFSLSRPFLLWLGSLVFIGLAHGALAGPNWLQTGVDYQRTMQWAQYVLFNAIPLPGFDKVQFELRSSLFGPSSGAILVAIVLDMMHKTFALLSAFLVGLALRNLFKMKG